MAVTFYELFLEFLRRNAMVAVVILAVLLARLLLKKALAFGESDASKRIKNVLRYKKPRLISAVVAVLALAVISLVCLTNASETTEQEAHTGLDEKTADVHREDGGDQPHWARWPRRTAAT